MLANSPFPSVPALALMRYRSEYDDRANLLYNKFPPISEIFRHLSYRLRKHFHLISIRFLHISAKSSQISEDFLGFQPEFTQLFRKFSKKFSSEFQYNFRSGGRRTGLPVNGGGHLHSPGRRRVRFAKHRAKSNANAKS